MKLGTDCSGIEAPVQALKKLKLNVKHEFASEIDKYCIESLKANYKIPIIYNDMCNRDPKSLPEIDLYVCGFPCQPFSQAGDRKGLSDVRGNIFYNCIDVIKTKNPRYFLLENVKNIINHDKGNTWKIILSELEKLEKNGYNITWKILNTKDYGLPQNRERVYIVGTKEGDFQWPDKIKNCKKVLDCVDHTNKKRKDWKRKTDIKSVCKDGVFVDVDFLHYTNYPNSDKYSPCVVARGSSLWCVPYHRYATVKEFLMLQGFPNDFKQVVSDCQMKKQIGNSMSVNVLTEIFKNMLKI